MKKILAIILAILMVFAFAACGDGKTDKPAESGENKDALRYTGLDGETEGDGSIQKWAQNCSASYRYSQIMEGENDFTVWSDAVQLCCLNYFYYCGYSGAGYQKMRAGNPDYAVPDEHYAVVIDGDQVTYYDFYRMIKATGEAWDDASCWRFILEDTGSHSMLYESIHRENWLELYENDKYMDTRIDELTDKTVAGKTCKGFREVKITHTEAYGDFEDVFRTIYYDPETGLGLDCIDHELTTAFVFDKVEYNCVTPDDVKSVIEEQKKGITFTDMTLDDYAALKGGY